MPRLSEKFYLTYSQTLKTMVILLSANSIKKKKTNRKITALKTAKKIRLLHPSLGPVFCVLT